MQATHRKWYYSKDGGRIFEAGEDVPRGWFDSPALVVDEVEDVAEKVIEQEPVKYPSQMNKSELESFAESIGADISKCYTRRDMLDVINAKMKEDSSAAEKRNESKDDK